MTPRERRLTEKDVAEFNHALLPDISGYRWHKHTKFMHPRYLVRGDTDNEDHRPFYVWVCGSTDGRLMAGSCKQEAVHYGMYFTRGREKEELIAFITKLKMEGEFLR